MYAISDIASVIGAGEESVIVNGDASVAYLQFDSRNIAFSDHSLFFALKGLAADGHQFVHEAYERGVRNFVLTYIPEGFPVGGVNVLLVDDTLSALQRLAAWHRRHFDVEVFGITGSNGKTVVKEWLYQLLSPDYRVLRSPRSYNSQLGVPLSVWRLHEGLDMALFEAGISTIGQMEKLAEIIEPTRGIFTMLGPAHDAGFSDRAEKLEEKLKLFEPVKTIYYGCDQADVRDAIRRRFAGKKLLCWSRLDEGADLYLLSQSPADEGKGYRRLRARFQAREREIVIPFSDRASVENAMLCWLVLLDMGLPDRLIAERMAELEPVAMRLELRPAINGSVLINDAYNNDLASLEIALRFLERQRRGLPSVLVLTDILQSGEEPEKLYREVARLLKEQPVDELICIGEEIGQLRAYLQEQPEAGRLTAGRLRFYPDTRAFLRELEFSFFAGKAILLKGARKFQLEMVADRLAEKVHQTALEINLDALRHNLGVFRNMLRPGVRMLVMVKAAAYGSGAVEMARLLEQRQVAYLGVAYADEGVALRQAGIRLPIMVMNPEPGAFAQMLRYELEPEIYSLSLLRAYLRATQGLENIPGIHLKLETGMHRLGLEVEMLSELQSLLSEHNYLRVKSVFSHLSASEQEAKDAFTRQQAQRFKEMYESLASALGYRPLAHLLNSEGIARFPDLQFDMVRLGIGFYGISAREALRKQLQFALSLKARISQIKTVAAGEPVGYGAEAKAERDRRIATVSIGYADGLLRLAGNGRFSLLVRGQEAPTVGNVCMDMCMIDVTHIPEAAEGDEVIVFSEEKPIEELAQALRTIPYEVLTNISERVRRVYVAG